MTDTIAREDTPEIMYAVFTDGDTYAPFVTTPDEDTAYDLADDRAGRVVTYEKA